MFFVLQTDQKRINHGDFSMSFSNYKIKVGDEVIFRYYFHHKHCKCCKEEIDSGVVTYVLRTSDAYSVSFLRGLKSESENVSLDDILGVGDPTRTVPIVQVDAFRGYIILSDEEKARQDKENLKNKISEIE